MSVWRLLQAGRLSIRCVTSTATKRNKRCMIIFLMKLGLKNRLSYFVEPETWMVRFYCITICHVQLQLTIAVSNIDDVIVGSPCGPVYRY